MQLDAKKSPLALLAQTCSAIGKDNSASIDSLTNINGNQTTYGNGANESRCSVVGKSERTTKLLSLSKREVVDVIRRNKNESPISTNSNSSSTLIRASSNGAPTRKLSAPVFSKTPAMTDISPKRYRSPLILQSSEISSRTRSSTPVEVLSDSPSVSEKTCSVYTDHREKRSHTSRFSPIKRKQKSSVKTPERISTNNDITNHESLNNFASTTPRNRKENLPTSTVERKAVTTTCNLPAHSLLCGCKSLASMSEFHLNSTHPSLHGPIAHETKSPTSKSFKNLNSYSACDRFCIGCQYPHIPEVCDLTALKQNESYYPMYHMDANAPGAGVPNLSSGIPNCYVLQSQLMFAALAARNDYLGPCDATLPTHVCKWVTATEGNCGKRFSTREELLEHLSTHAVSSSGSDFNGYSNFLNSSMVASNHFGSCFNLGINGFNPHNISNHLANVNERYLQTSQRRCNPLLRYHPFKTHLNSNPPNSYLPFMPPAASASTLWDSPYSFYGQPVGASANPIIFP